MTCGLRIGLPASAVDTALVARFAKLPTAVISDSMNRLVAGGAQLRPMSRAAICAQAVTVKTAPGDNLMVHKALDLARPGEVIVVDAGGALTNAIMGERMLLIAQRNGLAGLIINGAIRDLAVIRESSLPVYAAGVTHRGPYKNGPGEINFPIAIGGMVICPGDLIVADDDGIVCVPRADMDSVCVAAERKADFETNTDPLTESRAWIDEALRAGGCEFPAEDA